MTIMINKNHMIEGVCLGVLAYSIGMGICTVFGQIVFGGICMPVEILIGKISLCIKKEKCQKTEFQPLRKFWIFAMGKYKRE